MKADMSVATGRLLADVDPRQAGQAVPERLGQHCRPCAQLAEPRLHLAIITTEGHLRQGKTRCSQLASGISAKAVSIVTMRWPAPSPGTGCVDRATAGRGFELVCDTGSGAILDASFAAVRRFGHVVSALGWGTHTLAPLSFRAASYTGVFTLLPLLTDEGRAHHGEILEGATRLAEAGKLVPRLDPRRFTQETVTEAHDAVAARAVPGKVVIDSD